MERLFTTKNGQRCEIWRGHYTYLEEIMEIAKTVHGEDMDEDFLRYKYEKLLENDAFLECRTYVAKIDGKIVGFGAIIESPLTRWVCEMISGLVHPDYQRQGIGRELVLARLGWAKEKMPPESIVFVCSTVPKIFERIGFTYFAPKFWADGDAELMLLNLDQYDPQIGKIMDGVGPHPKSSPND